MIMTLKAFLPRDEHRKREYDREPPEALLPA
jgi:hypothetical protein